MRRSSFPPPSLRDGGCRLGAEHDAVEVPAGVGHLYGLLELLVLRLDPRAARLHHLLGDAGGGVAEEDRRHHQCEQALVVLLAAQVTLEGLLFGKHVPLFHLDSPLSTSTQRAHWPADESSQRLASR